MDPRERFLGLAALLPEPMLLVTMDGRIVAANPAFAERLAVPRSSLAGQLLTDLTLSDPAALLDHLRLCSGSCQLLMAGLVLQPPAGDPMPCRIEGARFAPGADGSGALVALRVLPRDATTARFVELNLKLEELSREIARRIRSEEALREQHEWLEVTLTSIGDAVIATDRDGAVVFLNGVAESLTQWPREEALGRPVREVFRIVNEHTRAEVESPVDLVLDKGLVVGLANHTVLIARDGTERPIADSGALIRDPERGMIGVVLVFRDVTRERETERAAAAARDAAENANRAKDQFLAVLSHELRTPLNAILGWARMLRLGTLDEQGRERAIEIISRNADLQAVLIEDLLDVSRIISGKLHLRQESVRLRTIAESALDAVRPAADNKGVHLEPDVREVRDFIGDPGRLQQVVWNLLSNAVKFTPPGGRVRLHLAEQPGALLLTVSDTGQGFDPAFRPYLFDAFRQADVSLTREGGGLGLGLTIVRHLVEAHGGRVDAHSRGTGQGATFTVTLPQRPRLGRAG